MLSGTTNYTLHGKNIVHMTQGSNNLHFFYDASNKPAIVEYNGTKYAYVHNLQGDIVAIVDSNGTAVVQYKYDAWGRPISKTGSLANTLGTVQPFRYRSYVCDEEIGLYYLRSRYYSVLWCRFLNVDSGLSCMPLIGINLFAYCRNKAVVRKDSSGLCDGDCANNKGVILCHDCGIFTPPDVINPQQIGYGLWCDVDDYELAVWFCSSTCISETEAAYLESDVNKKQSIRDTVHNAFYKTVGFFLGELATLGMTSAISGLSYGAQTLISFVANYTAHMTGWDPLSVFYSDFEHNISPGWYYTVAALYHNNESGAYALVTESICYGKGGSVVDTDLGTLTLHTGFMRKDGSIDWKQYLKPIPAVRIY